MTNGARRRNTDTSNAIAANMRRAQNRKAAELNLRGWVCISPDRIAQLTATQTRQLEKMVGPIGEAN